MNPNGSFGETLRGEFFGPSRSTVDLGLFKRFRFSNDMNLQFRAEFFNLFNTVNFNNPGTTVNTAATFGRITAAQDPRIMQPYNVDMMGTDTPNVAHGDDGSLERFDSIRSGLEIDRSDEASTGIESM